MECFKPNFTFVNYFFHGFRCYVCKREIPIDVTKKIQSCADLIKKQYNDNLPFSPVRIESGEDTLYYILY